MSINSEDSSKTDILIVGAGPSGLMMACQLARHGANFRIIDKSRRTTNYSGALLIQARTLEIWAQMGIVNDALRLGQIAKSISVVRQGRKMGEIDIDSMGQGTSEFPFILMLKQTYTEELLLNFLEKYGIKVERQTELTQLDVNEKNVRVELLQNHKQEMVVCKYLIGADGVYSKVRNLLNIPWLGSVNQKPLFVTDCALTTLQTRGNQIFDVDQKGIVFSISKQTIAGFFPLEGKNWRIDSLVPKSHVNSESIKFADITETFPERTGIDAYLSSPHWFSVFKTNTFHAQCFQRQNSFLIGDAAHVHTPIGAQGMNTGMQDAYNLAWKLAFRLKHNVSSRIPETYEEERLPIAKKLLKSTDKYFDYAIRDDLFSSLLRIWVLPFTFKFFRGILSHPRILLSFFKTISETNLSYQNSSLNLYKKKLFVSRKWRGRQWPFMKWIDEQHVERNSHELISGKCFVLICLNGNDKNKLDLPEEIVALQKEYEALLVVKKMSYSKNLSKLYKILKVNGLKYFLVRPDGYISAVSNQKSINEFSTYFNELLKPE